jgi:glycerol-1-phosphate dehydrogenase [NAD(P)+]
MAYQQLRDAQDFLSRKSSGLANTALACPYCGRVHKIPYQAIQVGPGVLQQVPELVQRALGHKPQKVGVIYDQAIEGIIEHQYLAPFISQGLPVFRMPLGEEDFWLDSTRELGDEAAARVPADVEILIAAGSGVICDLTKWIATYSHKPFILCGSAPSMNGYTSITAVINEHDIKLTKYVDIPYAVVLDTHILAHAPVEMIQAGVGDMAARAICNADWKLSNFLQNSYFCPLPYQMTAASEASYLAAAEGICVAQPGAIADLSEAIAISGLSMSILDGETSPSSGGEHVISHFWDFMSHLENAPRNLHGAQVGVGTVMMLAAYELFREIDPASLDPDRLVRSRLSLEAIQARNTARFGAAAAPLNETSQKKYLPPDAFKAYIYKVVKQWDQLWEAINPYTAPLQTIRSRMQAAGLPLSLDAVQRTRQQAVDALLFGGRYRQRFTFLDLAWDLGLFPDAADEILERSGVLHG